MTPAPGTLLRSRTDLIGTGFPHGDNVIMKDRICMFVKVRPFNDVYLHYQVLVLNYHEHPIVDDIIVTPAQFGKYFQVLDLSEHN